MTNGPDPIRFQVDHFGEEISVTTFPGEYRNLMVLLNNTIYLEDFGECGGMGRCATCRVRFECATGMAPALQRNEKATLDKTGETDPTIRLSCQLHINKELEAARIVVL